MGGTDSKPFGGAFMSGLYGGAFTLLAEPGMSGLFGGSIVG